MEAFKTLQLIEREKARKRNSWLKIFFQKMLARTPGIFRVLDIPKTAW